MSTINNRGYKVRCPDCGKFMKVDDDGDICYHPKTGKPCGIYKYICMCGTWVNGHNMCEYFDFKTYEAGICKPFSKPLIYGVDIDHLTGQPIHKGEEEGSGI
jgi:hypothetical protein